MAIWYYESNGAQQGPVDEAEAVALLANGTLTVRSLVWREGLVDWVPLHQSELSRYLASPSAPPPPPPPPFIRGPGGAGSVNPYQPPQAISSDFPYVDGPRVELTWTQILWSFEGRIPRRSYWAGIGIWIGVFMVMGVFFPLLFRFSEPILFLVLLLPLMVLFIWSSLALQIKRWHDRNKPGVMVLINLIPYVGGIWTFVECGCLRGTEGHNSYGSDPT
ncbi:MAG: DUF805 domain-containing protein [Verrucomicrobiota bacterium]